ncbi:MAG: DUF599 family protein [Sneathiella sp.]|nr:DUF599 family protein [Sneathiella sp.]
MFEKLSILDFVAPVFMLVLWLGYSLAAAHFGRSGSRSIMAVTHDYRVLWMRRMLDRDMRVGDINICSAMGRSASTFASTSIFIMAGLITLFGALDQINAVLGDISFVASTDRLLIEIKLMILVLIFVFAFFKFAWSMRQFNFALILIGGAPMPAEPDVPDRVGFSERTASVIDRATNSFNHGLRAYYFALATLTWVVHPVVFMVAAVLVLAVLYRREFRSHTHRFLVEAGANLANETLKNDPKN